MKLEFSQLISKKHSNIKFLKNRSSGSRAVTCRQTDRQHDKANSHFFAILRMHLKQDQIQYSIFYSSSYTNSEDKVPINQKAPNTKSEFLAISGSRNITRKVSQICGTYITMHK